MTDHSVPFFVLTLCAFLTILLVFGMKYFAQARQFRASIAGRHSSDEGQSPLNTLQADMNELKSRLGAIEKILKDVE